MLQLFKDQDARAFTDHKAIAVAIKRAACVLGIIVASRQRAHRGEPADAHRRDRGFGASADHRVGVASLNDLEAVADGVRARRTGRTGRRVRPLEPEPNRYLARGQIDDRRRNKEGRYLARPALQELLVLALDDAEPADPRPDVRRRSACAFVLGYS